jgi:hypothetical protein
VKEVAHSLPTRIYCDVHVTNKTGSSSNDWIYYQLVTHSLVITFKYSLCSVISHLHNLQSTVAHALGSSLSTSRLLATDLDTQTVTALHSKYYTRRKSFSHISSLLTAMNFPLLLHLKVSSEYFGFPANLHSTNFFRITTIWGWHNRPVVAAVPSELSHPTIQLRSAVGDQLLTLFERQWVAIGVPLLAALPLVG